MLSLLFKRQQIVTRNLGRFSLATKSRNIHTETYNKKLTFYLNGNKVVLDKKVEPDTTLIEYIRNQAGLTGTKLTCGEGGCGACTVTVSHFDKTENKVVHRAVNSCLVPLCYVDGMEVTTVEGIGSTRKGLHPVQERMALFGGSQCGFCTPGFVMSMYTGLKNNPTPTAQEFTKSMDGNLCRCTGYRPIIDAAKTFCADTKNTVKPPDNRKFAPYDPSKDPQFPSELKDYKAAPMYIKGDRSEWYAPTTLQDLLKLKSEIPHAKLIAGSTELGIDIRFKSAAIPVFLSPVNVPELNQIEFNNKSIQLGSAVTLGRLYEILKKKDESLSDNEKHRSRLLHAIMDQLHYFAGTQIRNVASLGGNIVNASPISDLNPVFLALGAQFTVMSAGKKERKVDASDFFVSYRRVNMKPDEVLTQITIPWNEENEYIEAYKQSRRREDDIAIVTSCLLVKLDSQRKVTKAKLAFGGMAPTAVLAQKTENFLLNKEWNLRTFDQAAEVLKGELGIHGDNVPGGQPEFRTALTLGFLYKFVLSVLKKVAPKEIPAELSSATTKLFEPRLPVGKQEYPVNKRGTSVGDSEPHLSSRKQVSGEALYTDDIPKHAKELFGFLVTSTKGHAKIKSIDIQEALKHPGVRGVFTHKDIPGKNLWGDIVADEELLASEEVVHYGQPIAVVVAEDEHSAKRATKLVKIEYEELDGVYSIDEAIEKKSFFPVVHGIKSGDVDKAFTESDHVIEGEINMSGQEQFYFETQISLAVPDENDFTIYTSTQNAHKTQKIVAAALGLPANRVVCKVARLGGGFGGKETRNINFSSIAAVAAYHLNRPVRLNLERDLDMTISGGRHPFKGLYRVGFNKDGMIKAADLKLYSNGGISHDLSVPVLDRALLFCDGCYHVPNLRNTGQVCKTNLASNTAFRGFGGPQGQLITEAWVEHMAAVLNVTPETVREKNLYKEGESTYYGQTVTKNVRRTWDECRTSSQYDQRLKAIEEFNAKNKHRKRGIAIMPSKYGIGFTANFLNQGAALIHIYLDGSVLVTHGGVEMGQGLHTKVAQVVATEFGIPVDKVHIKEMATDKIPNASPTAASMGSDIYGLAALNAAKELNARLAPIRAANPEANFAEIVVKAYFDRINLSAQGFFKSEHKGFDFGTGNGFPWRYFTIGTACTEVEIDCLTGDHKILRNDLVLDLGDPINPAIDIGQIEGAFVQGAGWVSIEELIWGDRDHEWVKPKGRLQTSGPGAYKIPAADDIPADWRVTLLKAPLDAKHEVIPVQSSKAVGEPPLLLGISVYLAIKEAIKASRKQEGLTDFFPFPSPATSERIRMACVDNITRMIVSDKKKAEYFPTKGSF